MHQKLEDSEALINALRAELSEENSMHQKELRKVTDTYSYYRNRWR